MFDPFSAMGALGFITGSLGFIVSTLPKVDEKSRAFREHGSSIRAFGNRLEDAYFDLRAWTFIWAGKKGYPNSFYMHVWGLDGLESVNSRLKDILEESKEIEKLLYQPTKVGKSLEASSELKYWTAYLARLPLQEKDRFIDRVIFAFFRNDTLKEKIERLENSIKGLRKSTQQNFRLRHDDDPGLKVTGPELRLLNLQLFVNRISDIGSSLYRSLTHSSTFEWAIELGPPETDLSLDLSSEMEQMYVDFIVRAKAEKRRIKARRMRIYLENLPSQTVGSSDLMEQTVEKVFLGQGSPEFDSGHNGIFDILEHPVKRSRALKKMLTAGIFSGEHRKDFELERADLVYGLGHWMVLLWNTPWFSDFCTCGIRCIHLANTHTRHSFLPRPGAGHMDRDSECHPSEVAENRFELLGVRLAEIALARPISVHVRPFSRRPFGRESYVIKGKSANPEQLLSMLKRQFGLNTITKAVSYCLGPDLAVQKDQLPPDNLEQYCRNIVFP